jgi:hypothetical protein
MPICNVFTGTNAENGTRAIEMQSWLSTLIGGLKLHGFGVVTVVTDAGGVNEVCSM